MGTTFSAGSRPRGGRIVYHRAMEPIGSETVQQPETGRPRGPAMLLLLGILLVMIVAVAARTRVATTLLDDTYIFCRYAANLAHGHGLVWNPGEPPVEGFTSPLLVFLLFLAAAAGLDPVRAAVALAVAAMAATALLTWRFGERLRPGETSLNLAAASAVALSAGGIYWAGTGMDEALFALLTLAAAAGALAFEEDRLGPVPYGLLLALLCLARPEGLAVAGTLLAFHILSAKGGRRRRAARGAGVFAVVMVVLLAVRWLYFHAPLPNTYYAKTGGGLLQLRAGLAYAAANWGLWLPGVAAVPFVLRRERRYVPLALAAVALTLAVVLEGGDQFGRARFFLPVFPLTVLLVAGLLPRKRAAAAPAAWTVAALSLLAWWAGPQYRMVYGQAARGLSAWHGPWRLVSLPRPPDPDRMEFLEDLESGFVVMGKTLARVAPPGSAIAVVPIGAIGWYSGLRVIDMVGLVNPVVAHAPVRLEPGARWRPGHNRGDGAAILRERPDFIQLQDALSSRPAPRPHPFMLRYTSVAEIWSSPEFWTHYEFYPIRTESGWYYNLYRRKEGDGRPVPVRAQP